MTADVLTADRPIPAPRRDWGAALRALRRLLRNKEDTRQVFEIMRALTGWIHSPTARSARPTGSSCGPRAFRPMDWPV